MEKGKTEGRLALYRAQRIRFRRKVTRITGLDGAARSVVRSSNPGLVRRRVGEGDLTGGAPASARRTASVLALRAERAGPACCRVPSWAAAVSAQKQGRRPRERPAGPFGPEAKRKLGRIEEKNRKKRKINLQLFELLFKSNFK
jgi:hypothetical protein